MYKVFPFFFHNKILSVTKLLFDNGSWPNCDWEIAANEAKYDDCPLLKSCHYTAFGFLSVISLKEQSQLFTPEYPVP